MSLPAHHTWGGGGHRNPEEQEWAITQQLGPRAWGCPTDMWTAHAHLQAKDASRMPAGQAQVWVKAGPPTRHCLAGRICPQPAPMWREGATSQHISDTWGSGIHSWIRVPVSGCGWETVPWPRPGVPLCQVPS
ncbi:hypothetical protein mRhiFer1_009503 [Rhinolophus ferrumequinum]|uniref:Uncharacterized protein n=1 Tax=Rhinolophus ferrumequinum TaxID=59479 RepID=A0A7J7RB79_RHIFE|nr:hypothetical protein mRhiFer1_009503 [Rhinolophus ferrumequinum]